jgi:hypothetical protein
MFYNDLWRYWGFGGTQETEVWIRDSEETHMEGGYSRYLISKARSTISHLGRCYISSESFVDGN